ncbi:MAG: DUF4956 domain-containing protein [Patescibacteria group bacterium]
MEKFLFLAETQTSAAIIILNIFVVFCLELIITWVYRQTHRTLSYSQSFVFTIMLMGIVASLIMMVVTENIVGAFALLGAFSLIRFRTIVKETRDIAFVFLSLAIGVAVGTNNYTVAIIGTVFISGIILLLNQFNFGSGISGGHILIVAAGNSFSPENPHAWQQHIKNQNVLHIKTLGEKLREYTIAIQLINPSSASKIVQSLQSMHDVESVELISGKDAVEY